MICCTGVFCSQFWPPGLMLDPWWHKVNETHWTMLRSSWFLWENHSFERQLLFPNVLNINQKFSLHLHWATVSLWPTLQWKRVLTKSLECYNWACYAVGLDRVKGIRPNVTTKAHIVQQCGGWNREWLFARDVDLVLWEAAVVFLMAEIKTVNEFRRLVSLQYSCSPCELRLSFKPETLKSYF